MVASRLVRKIKQQPRAACSPRRKWAIPFLDRYGQMLGGVVMLAPVGVDIWGGPWEFTHKQVRAA